MIINMKTLNNIKAGKGFSASLWVGLLLMLHLFSCKGFLDVKPSKALLVPTTLSDFDALLDNTNIFNTGPELNEIASDDLYTTDDGWVSLSSPEEQPVYIFADAPFQGIGYIGDWDTPFQQVFYTNVVLDGLQALNPAVDGSDYNRVKGSALFQRAFAFYNAVRLFSKPYNAQTAATDLGIPLRLNSQVNIKSVRATVKATYDQVLNDLKVASALLPLTPKFKTRPCKPAALGLLARIYLSMGDYTDAGKYADSCLQLYNKLYDYNTLDSTSSSPLPQVIPDNGDEVIFYAGLTSYDYDFSSLTFVDSVLYRSYQNNDLRRVMFFMNNGSGLYNYKGTYTGNEVFFGGLATDEIYFIRAECFVRAGNLTAGLADLNTVLSTRWKAGTFVSFSAADADAALQLILRERRKELVARGLRWDDLRRLNTDPRFQTTVSHPINGQQHLLVPGDKHYVFPIPDYEIKLSGIQQN